MYLLPALCFIAGCNYPEWVGKYKSSENCLTLEYVEFFPDKTADIKYYSAPWPVNRPLKVEGNFLNVEGFRFEYRDNSVHEVSGLEWGCVMRRDTL